MSTQDTTKQARTTEQVRELAHGAVDNAADRAEDMEKKLREEASRFAARAEQGKEEAKKQVDETVARVDQFVRERPLAAVGIAFASGALATLLLKRS